MREKKEKPTSIKPEGITPHMPSRKVDLTLRNHKTLRKAILGLRKSPHAPFKHTGATYSLNTTTTLYI